MPLGASEERLVVDRHHSGARLMKAAPHVRLSVTASSLSNLYCGNRLRESVSDPNMGPGIR